MHRVVCKHCLTASCQAYSPLHLHITLKLLTVYVVNCFMSKVNKTLSINQSINPNSLNLIRRDLYTASECENEGLYIPRYLLHSVKVLHLQMLQVLFRLSRWVRDNAIRLLKTFQRYCSIEH